MNQENIQNIFIGLLVAGLILLGAGVYLVSQQVSSVANSVKNVDQAVMELKAKPEPSAAVQTQPQPSAGTVTYVSCRREYLSVSASWGDAKLLCTDGNGKETVILPSIDAKFGFSDANVSSIRLVSQGQIVYIGFRGEEDVAQFSLSYLNLKTGATGNLAASGVINSGDYVPEASAHYSNNGSFLVVAGGKQHLNPEYADLQTLYVFDLRSATLLTKISATGNKTFLANTDCFRVIGDISVTFTDDRMTYRTYDKPISTTEDQGLCTYTPKGGNSTDYALPR